MLRGRKNDADDDADETPVNEAGVRYFVLMKGRLEGVHHHEAEDEEAVKNVEKPL